MDISKLGGDEAEPQILERCLYLPGPRLDASNAHLFKEQAMSFIENGATRLVVDMSEVHMLDSTGLGAIIGMLKELSYETFILTNVRPAAMRVIKLTKMDEALNITVPDA